MGAATAAALMTWRPSADEAGIEEAIVVPPRTASDPPPTPLPPSVPARADAIPPLTFDVETTRAGGGRVERTTQTFVRTTDRVRVLLHGGRQEWHFVRNGIFPDRASGHLTDHTTRQIRFYDESPLRSEMRIRGWLDILTVRFDSTKLPSLRDTGERRQTYGTTFVRHVGAGPGEDGLVEVWWSESLLLPLSLTVRDAGIESTSVVRRLARRADIALRPDPRVRFPMYKEVDAADTDGH